MIFANGKLSDVKLVTSSGYKRLDDAALETVRNVKNFYASPADRQEEFLYLELPIKFSLL